MSFISLTTDFGLRDGTVGVMKGVIWSIAPEAKIADLSHQIEPQNVRQAAILLEAHAFYFPENTVHVVVVDPGVGTGRRPIAAQVGNQRFVGPDNGVFSGVLAGAERHGWPVNIVHTDKPEYWLPTISDIFHGRDIFSPVAAYLVSGVPLAKLGTSIDNPIRFSLPRPQKTEQGIAGQVIHIDHFGNMISNIHRDEVDASQNVEVILNKTKISGLARTFGERPSGELIALYSSTGYLMVAAVNGSAAERIKAHVGDEITVTKVG